jgi:hypothetical protein
MTKTANACVGSALVALVALQLVLIVRPSHAVTKVTSTYVSLKDGDCKSIGDNGPDDDFATLLCGTVAGWSVIIDYGDARDSITLRRAGKDTPLEFYRTVTGLFATVGDRYEFRMRRGVPIGTIVRLVHPLNGEAPEPKVSDLVVTRLTPTPCVIAIVPPGSKQNAKAQKLADTSTGKSCLKPAS